MAGVTLPCRQLRTGAGTVVCRHIRKLWFTLCYCRLLVVTVGTILLSFDVEIAQQPTDDPKDEDRDQDRPPPELTAGHCLDERAVEDPIRHISANRGRRSRHQHGLQKLRVSDQVGDRLVRHDDQKQS